VYDADSNGRLHVVPWTATPSPSVGTPTVIETPPLYEAIAPRSFDISPDGKRILVIEPVNSGTSDAPSLTVVLNWPEELTRATVRPADR
jgi:hypothetical protein